MAQPRGAGSCRPPGEGTAGLSRRLINKACHRRHARAGDRSEVCALGDDRASLRGQLPMEADAVVMPIDHPGAAEAVAGKTLLHRPYHVIDRSVPFAGHQRIDIAGVFAEGLGDQPLPPVGIDLVPHCDVALDQVIKFAHFRLLTYGTCFVRTGSFGHAKTSVDYLAGNWSVNPRRGIVRAWHSSFTGSASTCGSGVCVAASVSSISLWRPTYRPGICRFSRLGGHNRAAICYCISPSSSTCPCASETYCW